ncbi:MAG: MarR family winged helix-turn-helix transcriptional regulator [Acidimicrobiales bacterium]
MFPARVGAVATTYEHLALDQQLCFALHTASRAVTRAYAPLLERSGLTYPQYVTMLALWERAGEPLTVGALGSRLRLETGTLTPLLKRLEALGYVRRTRDRADERRVLVELSERGLALRDELATVPAALVQASGLEVDDIAELRRSLVELVRHLDAGMPEAARSS